MARNGPGNFDSDTASDYVGDLVAGLVKEVDQALANPDSIQPDEYYGEVVPCIVEVIAALHRLSGTAAIPSPEVIAGWRRKFLAAREKVRVGASIDHDPRGAAIRAAFDQLQEFARDVDE